VLLFKNKKTAMSVHISFIILLVLLSLNPLKSSDYETIWGDEKTSFITKYKSGKYFTFKAKDDPEYKNRIIDFFTSMDANDNVDITVVRINGKPEIDYCFFNEKLYSISENWGDIDTKTAAKLIQSIRKNFPGQSTEKKARDIIYSFKKNKTKILFQQNISGTDTVKVKIFYYSTDLFRMLFNEQ